MMAFCDMSSFLLWLLSLVAFLLYTAGFASPFWLVKKIGVPNPANLAMAIGYVDSDIGLVYACTDRDLSPININDYKCESLSDIDASLVEDWQWVAAGLGVGALICSVLALLAITAVVCRKKNSQLWLRGLVVVLNLLAGGLLVAVLVLFKENKERTISQPPITLKVEYAFGWSYLVVVASAAVFFVNSIVNVMVISMYDRTVV